MISLPKRKDDAISLKEQIFGISVLLYSSTAFIQLLMGSDDYSMVTGEGALPTAKVVLWFTTYLISGVLLFRRRAALLEVLKQIPTLSVLLVYVGISVVWSDLRSISVMSFGALLGNCLVGFYFGVRYSLVQFLRLLCRFCGIVAIATISSPFLIRNYKIDLGYWTGFFAQKNALGMVMTLGFVCFASLAQISVTGKWLYRGFAGLCAILIFLSGSATGEVIFIIILCVMLFQVFAEVNVSSIRWRIVLGSFALACLVIFVSWESSFVLAALGRSPDLTGRVEAWVLSLVMVRDRLLLGYGYAGFWIVGGPAQRLWDILRVDPGFLPNAHNGYLQILVDCGVVGLVLFAMFLVAVAKRAWACFVSTRTFWPAYFVMLMLLLNLADSSFVVRNDFGWLLFVAVTLQLVRVVPRKSAAEWTTRASMLATEAD